jgi:hypothetical protein
MIRINQAGLSETERNSVAKPLAENADGHQDIDTLGDNLAIVVERYGSVFSEAIERINNVHSAKK